jgi:hypothetical protein
MMVTRMGTNGARRDIGNRVTARDAEGSPRYGWISTN